MHPTTLMSCPRIHRRNRRRQTRTAIRDDQRQVLAFQPAAIQILEQAFPVGLTLSLTAQKRQQPPPPPPLKRLQTTGQKALLASTRNPQPDGAEAGHKIPLVVAVAIDSPSATPPFVPPPARIAIALPLRLQLEKPLPG